jgi:ComF family protein
LGGFLDFFIPRFCPACNSKLETDEISVCKNCLASIKKADIERLQNEFERKFANTGLISDFTSLFVFEQDKAIQPLIHSIKYNKRFLNAKHLGKLIAANFEDKLRKWEIDYIVPIPLHQLKKAERGYNQSYYIALGLGKYLGIPVKNNLIKRVRYTETQTNLTLGEREKNISGAFRAKRKRNIANKTFLLVDDVITTGATIRECAKVLLDNEAISVYACSAAIAD